MQKIADILAIDIVKKGEVTQFDTEVVALAQNLGFLPATLVERMNQSLPTVVERRLYVLLATGMTGSGIIRPITFSRIIRSFAGYSRQLDESSILMHNVGKNLEISEVDQFIDFLNPVFDLIRANDYNIDVESACKLVHTYGDYANEMLGLIADNAEGIVEELMNRKARESGKVQRAVKYVVERILPVFEENGLPAPLTIADMFTSLSDKLENMKRS